MDVLSLCDSLKNCLVTAQAIRGNIEECKALLLDLKDKGVVFRFVKRSANDAAHFLTRYSCSISYRIWRMSNVHPEFSHVLENELI